MGTLKKALTILGIWAIGFFPVVAGTAKVYAASPGTLGSWTGTSAVPDGVQEGSTVVNNGYIYQLGGFDSTGHTINNTYYAPLNANGTIGTWNTTTVLPITLGQSTTVVNNGYIYMLGGYNFSADTNNTYYAPLNANGTIGTWSTTTVLPASFDSATSAVYNGYVYVLGGHNNSGAVNTTYYAPLNANGTIGTWSTTTVLPASIELAASVVHDGYIYELGGLSNNAINTVYYAPLSSSGIGAWKTTTVMPDSLYGASAVVSDGHVFEIGGIDQSTDTNTVYDAAFGTNGSLGTWTTNTALPNTAVYSTAAANNGYLYLLSGLQNSINPVANVYYAPITSYPSVGISNMTSTVTSGSSITVNVLSGVSGDPDSNTLKIVSGPSHGIAVDPPGTITYTANSGYVGSDSLVYSVCSLDDEDLCSQATLTFNVSAAAIQAPDTGFGTPATHNPWTAFAAFGLVLVSLVSSVTGSLLLRNYPKR